MDHSFSWAAFVTQQIGVPVLGFLVAGGLANLPLESKAASVIVATAIYASPVVLGWTLGRLARSMGPTFRAAGRGVWVAPTFFFLVVLLSEFTSDPKRVLPEFLGTSSRNPEAAFVAVLLTFPAVTCCFYALGIGRKKETDYSQ